MKMRIEMLSIIVSAGFACIAFQNCGPGFAARDLNTPAAAATEQNSLAYQGGDFPVMILDASEQPIEPTDSLSVGEIYTFEAEGISAGASISWNLDNTTNCILIASEDAASEQIKCNNEGYVTITVDVLNAGGTVLRTQIVKAIVPAPVIATPTNSTLQPSS